MGEPLGDECCPECGGERVPEVFLKGRRICYCAACGHRWAEELPPEPDIVIVKGGWVRFKSG